MSVVYQVLDQALVDGVLSSEQAGELKERFARHGVAETADIAPETEADGEAPRFLRGFHDILITIGVIAALAGLWGMAGAADRFVGPLATLAAIVPLAEILVRRQRLALPAFALTVFTVAAAFHLGEAVFADSKSRFALETKIAWGALFPLIALVPFYWRYKVPAALAALFAAAAASALPALVLISNVLGVPPTPRMAGLHGLLLAGGLFSAAMWFDLSDKLRRTRRSDVAFWLHMIAAPALLYSTFLVVFGTGLSDAEGVPQAATALTVLAIIVVMMIVGVIIDRRAFVTSGLTSLGIAFYTLFQHAGFLATGLTPFAMLLVGITVLVLGTGWVRLRELLLAMFPASLRERLPPVKR